VSEKVCFFMNRPSRKKLSRLFQPVKRGKRKGGKEIKKHENKPGGEGKKVSRHEVIGNRMGWTKRRDGRTKLPT